MRVNFTEIRQINCVALNEDFMIFKIKLEIHSLNHMTVIIMIYNILRWSLRYWKKEESRKTFVWNFDGLFLLLIIFKIINFNFFFLHTTTFSSNHHKTTSKSTCRFGGFQVFFSPPIFLLEYLNFTANPFFSC